MALRRFAVGEGDLVTYLNVWKAWQESGRDRRWAARNCLNHRTLLRAADIRSQLCHHLRWTSRLIPALHLVFCQELCSLSCCLERLV